MSRSRASSSSSFEGLPTLHDRILAFSRVADQLPALTRVPRPERRPWRSFRPTTTTTRSGRSTEFDSGHREGQAVITSYSIHYTKLYEMAEHLGLPVTESYNFV